MAFGWGTCKKAAFKALKALAPAEKVEDALLGAMNSKNGTVRTWATKQLVPAN